MEAARALNIHEKAVGRLNQSLKLVLGFLVGSRGVKQVLWHFFCKEAKEILE